MGHHQRFSFDKPNVRLRHSTNWISESDPNTKQIEVSRRSGSSIRDWHAMASYGMTTPDMS